MGKSGYSAGVIFLMIWALYFGILGIGNNSGYNLCIVDKEKFFIENPDMSVWGIWKISECEQFKDFRDIFILLSMPFIFLSTIKQQHNAWKNNKAEIINDYNPTHPPMFYVSIMIISAIVFISSIYIMITIQNADWFILAGIFLIPMITGGILTSSMKRYWVLKEKSLK